MLMADLSRVAGAQRRQGRDIYVQPECPIKRGAAERNGFRTRDNVKPGAGRDPPRVFLQSVDALADEDVDGNAAVLRLALLAFIVRQRVGFGHSGRG